MKDFWPFWLTFLLEMRLLEKKGEWGSCLWSLFKKKFAVVTAQNKHPPKKRRKPLWEWILSSFFRLSHMISTHFHFLFAEFQAFFNNFLFYNFFYTIFFYYSKPDSFGAVHSTECLFVHVLLCAKKFQVQNKQWRETNKKPLKATDPDLEILPFS